MILDSSAKLQQSIVAPKSKIVHDQALCCYPNVRFGIWVLTPPFSPFSSYSIISEKIFGLQFKCIFLFCHQSLCSCTKIAHGWSCIKTLDLSKHSNDQFELQPRHTFSGNMCPKGISRGTSSIWKVKFSVKWNDGFYISVSRLSLQFFITIILNPPWTKP